MLATIINNYNVQKCRQWMLAIISSRTDSDNFQQLEIQETVATNGSNYKVHKGWRQMLTIIVSGVHHKNYNYDFWRAQQKKEV